MATIVDIGIDAPAGVMSDSWAMVMVQAGVVLHVKSMINTNYADYVRSVGDFISSAPATCRLWVNAPVSLLSAYANAVATLHPVEIHALRTPDDWRPRIASIPARTYGPGVNVIERLMLENQITNIEDLGFRNDSCAVALAAATQLFDTVEVLNPPSAPDASLASDMNSLAIN